jgi:hypothetical protein
VKVNGPVFKSPVAGSIPYDDTIQAPLSGSDDVQAILDWLKNRVATSASPGLTWGRSGTVNANAWLLNDSVPSNICGRIIFLNSAQATKVYVANQDATAGIVFGVYEHSGDGLNMTLLGTVTTTAVRANTFTVAWNLTFNKQLAVKIQPGSSSAKNPVIGVLIQGTVA